MTTLADKAVRRWFITGASGGMGSRLTEHALRHGDHVTATVRPTEAEALNGLRETYGDRLTVESLDLTRPADIDTVISRTLQSGPVDIVVNNAGYALMGAAEEMTAEQIRDQIEVLLLAPMLITRAFLKPMRKQGGGRIIQMSGAGGQMAMPAQSAYHAGRWGLEGFTESVGGEVADFDIRLTLIEPGAMRTGFNSAMRYTTETGAYRTNAVGQIRGFMQNPDPSIFTGDPAKVAAAIYDTTRDPNPPLRLALGADGLHLMHNALTERLAALEAQKDLAASVAFTD
ncbi:SDR family oxidoreductase [Nonomuraea sp. NPDC005650]|uniref:SDR family oxidoreductase n=1 Tax=Nonomuraea sp. NPDC005650 TaxID=3157045 RepID=UPI0033A417BF